MRNQEEFQLLLTLKNCLLKLSLLILSTVSSFMVCELTVRIIAPQQLIQLRPSIWIPSTDGLGWRMAANVDATINTGERSVRLTTDREGFRAPVGGYSEDSRKILALGDSFLAAIQVPYEQSVGAFLGNSLSLRSDEQWEIVNSGVGGWGPSHYLLEGKRQLAAGRYSGVIVFFFLGNDLEIRRVDRFPPKEPSGLHSFHWPATFDFHGLVEAFAYPANDYLERRSHFFMFLRNRFWQVLMKVGLSARKFPESVLVSEAESKRWSVTTELLVDIKNLCDRYRLPHLVVFIPGKYQVDRDLGLAYAEAIGLQSSAFDFDQPSEILGELLIGEGLDFVDATPVFREARKIDGPDFFGTVDTHLSPEGHKLLAEIVAPRLESWIE